MHSMTSATPSDKTMLRMGELNAAATAIFGCPRLAMIVLATTSPIELPQAKTVNPKIELETLASPAKENPRAGRDQIEGGEGRDEKDPELKLQKSAQKEREKFFFTASSMNEMHVEV